MTIRKSISITINTDAHPTVKYIKATNEIEKDIIWETDDDKVKQEKQMREEMRVKQIGDTIT